MLKLASDAVSGASSGSLKVTCEKIFVGGSGVGCLSLHFFNCVELSSVSLLGAV